MGDRVTAVVSFLRCRLNKKKIKIEPNLIKKEKPRGGD